MATTVLTAPLAELRVGNSTIGFMRNVRVSETIRRGRVTGIGQMTASEVPAVEFTGTMNVGFYTINFDAHPLTRDAVLRKTGTTEKWVNTVTLQEVGLKVLLKRTVSDKINFPPDGRDANGIIQTLDEEFATITKAFLTSEGFDINEGQISGHDSTFEYLDPITYLV